jgi:hypothetical protein
MSAAHFDMNTGAAVPAGLQVHRQYSTGGLAVFRLSGRPERAGVLFGARPHYAVAPSAWTPAQVLAAGAICTTQANALVLLGELHGLTKLQHRAEETPEQRYDRIVRWAYGSFALPKERS